MTPKRHSTLEGEAGRLPLVTVVLPTYRRPDMLRRAVATVTSQTFVNWELLIVDDNGLGSDAQVGTDEVVRGLGDPRIVYLSHERNLGGSAARNTGIRAARAAWVAFLDDDDAWYPNKLELQVACAEAARADVAMVFGGFRKVSADGTVSQVLPVPGTYTMSHLLRRNTIGTTSVVMCRRDALLAVGGFDEALPSRQDIDLFVRLARSYAFAYVDELLLDKFQHDTHAIGKDAAVAVKAHELFYAKFRTDFEADRGAHASFVLKYAEAALRAGSTRKARTLFWRAWRLEPRTYRALGLLLVANHPVLAAYRFVRRLTGHYRLPTDGGISPGGSGVAGSRPAPRADDGGPS